MEKLTWKYVKELKKVDSVNVFEKIHSINLPNDVISCITTNNGGRPDRKVFDTNLSKGRVFKSLLSFNDNDIETIYDAYNIMAKENRNLIPIASDPGGNYICFDTKQKNMVLWLHETGKSELIAQSFTEFLNKLY